MKLHEPGAPSPTTPSPLAGHRATLRRQPRLPWAAALGGLIALLWSGGCDSSDSTDPGPTGQGGDSAECTTVDDCTDQAGDCRVAICVGGSCDTEDAPVGTACDDADGSLCDGAGECVECLEPSDCTESANCVDNYCVPAACADALHNGDETDVDCGGSCAPCDNGSGCLEDSDCVSGSCDATSTCAPCADAEDCDATTEWCNEGTCDDKKDNGAECTEDVECASGSCPSGVCES